MQHLEVLSIHITWTEHLLTDRDVRAYLSSWDTLLSLLVVLLLLMQHHLLILLLLAEAEVTAPKEVNVAAEVQRALEAAAEHHVELKDLEAQIVHEGGDLERALQVTCWFQSHWVDVGCV